DLPAGRRDVHRRRPVRPPEPRDRRARRDARRDVVRGTRFGPTGCLRRGVRLGAERAAVAGGIPERLALVGRTYGRLRPPGPRARDLPGRTRPPLESVLVLRPESARREPGRPRGLGPLGGLTFRA